MPKELRLIQSLQTFQAFFEGAYIKTGVLSNGDLRLSVGQRGPGGAPKGSKEIGVEVQKTMELIHKGQMAIDSLDLRQEGIIFIGRTRSGKSLLCNYVNGFPVTGKMGENSQYIFDAPDAPIKVSHATTKSCTKFPNAINPSDQTYSYVDCPGFGDTEG